VELFFAETPNGLGAEGNCLTLNAKVKSQFCGGKATRSYQQCQCGSHFALRLIARNMKDANDYSNVVVR
jgi:hypothetical protein